MGLEMNFRRNDFDSIGVKAGANIRQVRTIPINCQAFMDFELTPFFELNRNTCGISFWPPIPFSALFASNRVVTSSQIGEL
jgi:hypothetical protein